MERKQPITAARVKEGLVELRTSIYDRLPAMGWYFSSSPPPDAEMPDTGVWMCMFSDMERVANGETLCFSDQRTGCRGAFSYLGFGPPSPQAGRSLAEREGFKKNTVLGNAFYDGIMARPPQAAYLCLASIEQMDGNIPVEVVVLWTDAAGLSTLVTLANYDRPDNHNVVIPFASGCQSIWTIPFKEADTLRPKAVVGCIDPAVRPHIAQDTLSFALPARRFIEMTENIEGSFLQQQNGRKP